MWKQKKKKEFKTLFLTDVTGFCQAELGVVSSPEPAVLNWNDLWSPCRLKSHRHDMLNSRMFWPTSLRRDRPVELVNYVLLQPLSHLWVHKSRSLLSTVPSDSDTSNKTRVHLEAGLCPRCHSQISHQHLGLCHRIHFLCPPSYMCIQVPIKNESIPLTFLFMSRSVYQEKTHVIMQDLSTAKAFSDVLYLQINVVISSLKWSYFNVWLFLNQHFKDLAYGSVITHDSEAQMLSEAKEAYDDNHWNLLQSMKWIAQTHPCEFPRIPNIWFL